MPPRRSSNTLGSANVVDWKTMLDTAVVRNTIMDTRRSSALTSGECSRPAAFAFALGSPGRQKLAIGRQLDDAGVARVGHVDLALAVEHQVIGSAEVGLIAAGLAHLAHRCQQLARA